MSNFSAVKISENVYWVGAIDWKIRNMHGYSTPSGTSYNAYLVMGEKPILIDTVKHEFFDEMMCRIRSIINPEDIHCIISNHAEMDHSGSLVEAINTIKPDVVYASKSGKTILNSHFHSLNFDITTVENSQKLDIYGNVFSFFETKMLHWPDSMMSYYHNDCILFSQDGFGMHLATTHIFASNNRRDTLRKEAAKYFANILLPYIGIARTFINKLPSLGIDIKLIAPDHGPIWDNQELIEWIIGLYTEWAEQRYYNKAVVLYDSMWHSTELMAHVVTDVFMKNNIDVVLMPASSSERSDLATEILEAGIFMVGSPTLNNNMFPSIADMLYYIRGLKPKNIIGQAFGSYGWSGEGYKQVHDLMKDMKIDLIGEPISCKFVPTDDVIDKIKRLADDVSDELKKRIN